MKMVMLEGEEGQRVVSGDDGGDRKINWCGNGRDRNRSKNKYKYKKRK